MKRSLACAMSMALLASCQAASEPDPIAAPGAGDGWTTAPMVSGVRRGGGSILVVGTAAPLGRVVLTGEDGVAYAAGADEQGRFEVRAPAPREDAQMSVEAQVGQAVYPAPYRLLIAADAAGPIALLGIGAPTRRLDGAPALDAVDSDGRNGFLSGRAPPNAAVRVVNGDAGMVVADAQGRWSLTFAGAAGPVQVGDAAFAPSTTGGADGVLERAGQGWRIAWSAPGGGRQVTWFPDRPR